jgi:peroxiredoxin
MTLQANLKAITEGVRQQAPAEVFAAIEAANAKLEISGIAGRALKAGDRIPDFDLPDATGKVVRSADLLAAGPLVISFYRGSWCPYCSLELKTLQQNLSEFRARGATLVAISPQTPDESLTTKEKNELAFPVLSDAGSKVARKFGLVFTLDETLKPIFKAFGIDLLAHNGVDTWELPIPATYVVAKSGKIVSACVDVDYRNRAEPAEILKSLDKAE